MNSRSAADTPAVSWVGCTPGSGTPTAAEVRVQWPDGEVGPWITVDADRFVTIERGATEAIVWSPDE